MGRKTRRSGSSTGSIENDVQKTASEPVAESGRRRVSSGSSSVTDSSKSSNTPASKSRSKRGSSEFNKPTPKKKSAYAQLLENKQSSNDDDDVGKAVTSPSNAAKKGKGLRKDAAEKVSPSHGEASSGRRTRNTTSVSDAEASSGRPTRHCKAPSHDEASSGRRTRNSKSVGEPPEANIESVEVELVSNKTNPKKSVSRSDRGRANASPDDQVSANDGKSPKSSIKRSPTLNNPVDVNEERLRELEIETGVADTDRGAIDSTTG